MNSLKIEIVGYENSRNAIEQIRTKVFQEEQGVAAELEFDGMDAEAIQLLAFLNDEAVGTARIREIDRDTAKIERLAVLSEARGLGIGTQLTLAALEEISRRDKTVAIVHAQEYVISLYEKLGFEVMGERFVEAGITHVKAIAKLAED